MSHNNKHFTEIIENLSNNSENKITDIFFNLFSLSITYSNYRVYESLSGCEILKKIYIYAEYTYGNHICNKIDVVSDKSFLKKIKKIIKGEYYLIINTSKEYTSFGFSKYDSEEISKLKNMNIYKNYCQGNEIYNNDFTKQKYLYTTENLDELTCEKLFKLVNNDQYMKNSYFKIRKF